MLPEWVQIELALLPLVVGAIVYMIRLAIRFGRIEQWREDQDRETKQMAEILRGIARDLNQLIGEVRGVRGFDK